MKSLLTYYGGKQKMAPIIDTFIVPHVLYEEPFAGGAAYFWYKRPSEVEILNDINGELINFYRVVQNQYHELQAMLSVTLHSRQIHQHAWIMYLYPELFTPVQRAWAVWVLATQSFASRLDGSWGFDVSSDTTSKKVINSREEFTVRYAKRLEHVQLECKDALYMITSRDTPDSFFYCDPPYFNSDMGHYKGYTKRDFTELLDVLTAIKGKFLLSSYPSKILDTYVAKFGWAQHQVEQIVSVNLKSGKGKPKIEVLTANYPLVGRIPQMDLFGT
ncbi:DNA adenine methylase [Chitinophaga sedimenti]|uniref:DNA adenine methylase n=1 Tax=Chitinophaga sedimenti TaxID=2033606 RepID=UPI0020032EDE|nr:DNA adenine methylase [Chitinophaga sedimenti]MCK7559409.1 DNA adenine methylase [Chitinophaga sedimenti]